jgi:hypothetical protein
VTELVVGAGRITKRVSAQKPATRVKGKPHQRPQRQKPAPSRAEFDALIARVAALEAKKPKV